MKAFLYLFLALFTFGCAQSVTQINIPEIAKSDSVVLKDLRPENENSNEIFSYLITSDAYGINRIGDANMVPSLTRLLQHRVYEKFGNAADPLEIVVHHLVVYLNMKSQLKKGVLAGTIAGPVGVAVAAGAANNTVTLATSIVDPKYLESTAKDEHKRALYTEKENPNKASVIVTYIDAAINGKRVITQLSGLAKVVAFSRQMFVKTKEIS